jgi:IclR family transcriptional regulator, pca regulon regulatory protein
LHLGARLPAHTTSTGRVLLAAKSKAEFNAWMKGRELARLTAHTAVDPRKFRSLIEEVRVQDYCVASEEHELGVHALAVPLRNMQGQTVAALNVVAAPQRLEMRVMKRDLLPALLDAAGELRFLL